MGDTSLYQKPQKNGGVRENTTCIISRVWGIEKSPGKNMEILKNDDKKHSSVVRWRGMWYNKKDYTCEIQREVLLCISKSRSY